MSLRRVLLPVDFSPGARLAARLGALIARRAGAEAMLLFVDRGPPPNLPGEPWYLSPSLYASLEQAREEETARSLAAWRDEIAQLASPERGVRAEQRRGQPVPVILELAREWDADLIAIGSHGGRPAARHIFGSVTEQVSRAAPCPVLVTRGEDSPRVAADGWFHRALIGIDHSPFSLPCVQLAAEMVAPGGSLELLHVLQEPTLWDLQLPAGGGRAELEAAIERLRRRELGRLERLGARAALSSFDVMHTVGHGSAPRELLARADATGADLVVIGAHARAGVRERLIGTTADRVLRHADVPVLLLPGPALERAQAS